MKVKMHNAALSLQTTTSDQTSDVELAARASNGDELAFEYIMRRHNRLLFRTARSILKNDDETEDARKLTFGPGARSAAFAPTQSFRPGWCAS